MSPPASLLLPGWGLFLVMLVMLAVLVTLVMTGLVLIALRLTLVVMRSPLVLPSPVLVVPSTPHVVVASVHPVVPPLVLLPDSPAAVADSLACVFTLDHPHPIPILLSILNGTLGGDQRGDEKTYGKGDHSWVDPPPVHGSPPSGRSRPIAPPIGSTVIL